MSDEIGKLKVSLSLDGGAEFNRSLSSAERNLKTMGGELAIIRQKGKEWGSSIEGLKTRQETLGRTLQQQESYVKQLKDAYEDSVKTKGKDAKATENLATKLNKAIAEYTRTETEIEQVNTALRKQEDELKNTGRDWDALSDKANKAGDRIQGAGEKMKGLGQGLTVGVTAPILGLGTGALKVASDFESAQGRIQAQLGISKDEAKKLGDVSKDLWKNGFGENVTEVGDNLAIIKQNLRDLSDVELQKVTEKAYTLRDAFNAEINESTRTASVLMKNFEIDAGTAFDLITTGFQRGGDFSGELLDTLREYAPQFKGMGYDAEEFTAILIAGAETGAFNLDKVGDAAKEAFLRIGDGSKASRDSLEELGLDVNQIETDINSGGDSAKTAFAAVASAIAGVEDPAKKAQTAVALLGTPIEDLGPEFQDFFSTVNTDLGDFEGATDRAGDALYDNFGTRVQMQLRTFTSSLEPAGEILLDLGEEWLPKLSDALEDTLQWFESLGEEGQENVLMMAGLAAAAGPAITVVGSLATGVGGLVKVGGGLASLLGKAGGAGLVGKLGLMGMTGPVGLAVAGVAGLTLGIVALSDASEDNLKKTVEALDARKSEVDQLDTNIAKFEELRDKNELTTGEVLNYMDVMAELKDAKTEDAIKALTDEQALLLEKSGLTNAEMEEFLSLNEVIVENAPATALAISEQGEAYAAVLSQVKELSAAERERLAADTYNALYEESKKIEDSLIEQAAIQSEINELSANRKVFDEEVAASNQRIQEIDKEILGVRNQIKETGSEMSQAEQVALAEKLNGLQAERDQLTDNNVANQEQIQYYDTQIGKQEEKLSKVDAELALYDELSADYEALILSQAGLTAEKGKGLEKLREEQNGIDVARRKLDEQLATQQISTREYDTQNAKLDNQQAKIDEARGKLETMNEVAGRTIYKDLYLNESPTIDELNRRLALPVSKLVNVDYSVRRSLNLSPVANAYATGTRNAAGGLSLVGEEGPELVHLPRGAKVIPNEDTRSIFRKWDVPMDQDVSWHARGGVFTKPVVAGNAGCGDVEEAIVPFEGPHAAKIAGLIATELNRILSPMSQDGRRDTPLLVELHSTLVMPDGRVLAQVTEPHLTEMQNRNEALKNMNS